MKSIRHLWLLCLVLATGLCQAQTASDLSDASMLSAEQRRVQRDRIAAQRAEQEANLQAQESGCRQSFWVNGCLKDAQAAHRAVISRLDQQEHALGEVERRQRADLVNERTQARQEQVQRSGAQPSRARVLAKQAPALSQQKAQASAQQRMIKQQKKEEQASQRAQRREKAAQAAQAARADRLRRQPDDAASPQEQPR